jgi:Zn-dependent peptidase ImmA (M78 family)
MQIKLEKDFLPQLEKFFYTDSFYFDRAITFRKKRDEEEDFFVRGELNVKSLEELKKSIEIPIQIANICIEIAEIGLYVFDNAYKSARGDSQVAISNSVSALQGCLSIIQLNLFLLKVNEFRWTSGIRKQYKILKDKLDYLQIESNKRLEVLELRVEKYVRIFEDTDKFLSISKSKKNWTDNELENLAVTFQNLIWKHRKVIWETATPKSAFEILDVFKILDKVLNFEVAFANDLFDSNSDVECAGIIDQSSRQVLLSKKFNAQVQNFTSAHELGHAILHTGLRMHRDIPLDGTNTGILGPDEKQANKFASYFLMPRKLLESAFIERFGKRRFKLDEETSFRIPKSKLSEMKAKFDSKRKLSRYVASLEFYDGTPFSSLSSIFNVSVEAMAIRLEELNLIDFENQNS